MAWRKGGRGRRAEGERCARAAARARGVERADATRGAACACVAHALRRAHTHTLTVSRFLFSFCFAFSAQVSELFDPETYKLQSAHGNKARTTRPPNQSY